MPYYVPFYDNQSTIKRGCPPDSPQDLVALDRLRREAGLHICGEVWLQMEGIVIKYEGPVLDTGTQSLLCIKELESAKAASLLRATGTVKC